MIRKFYNANSGGGGGSTNGNGSAGPGVYAEKSQPENADVMIKKADGAISTMTVDLSGNALPDLNEAEVVPFDLSSVYWTPEKIGESKKVYFLKIETRPVQDQTNKEVVRDLPCAFFLEKVGDDMVTICNGSVRLVSCLENNSITKGCPLQITYLGKKKNTSNQFQSDQWKVNPLLINIKPADDAK